MGNPSSAPGCFPLRATRDWADCASWPCAAKIRSTPRPTSRPGDYTPAILTSWREVPSIALEQKELWALLRQAIDNLPESYRNIVVLRDIEELDIRETAAVLGISEGAVKVRLHRARALLQRELAPQLKAFAPKRKGWFGGRA